MGLNIIHVFEADSNMPKEVDQEYTTMVKELSCNNGHAFYFYIEEDSAYPLLTDYLVNNGVTDKCLIHVIW